jgi:hypothetical protein
LAGEEEAVIWYVTRFSGEKQQTTATLLFVLLVAHTLQILAYLLVPILSCLFEAISARP